MDLWKMWMEMQSGDSLLPIIVLIPLLILQSRAGTKHLVVSVYPVPSKLVQQSR